MSRIPREEIVACREYVAGRVAHGDTFLSLDEARRDSIPALGAVEFPETFVAALSDCRLYGRGVAVVGADGRVIAEGSAHIGGSPADHAIRGRAFLPPVTRLPGTTAVLSAPAGNTYYHWLFDLLPRVDLLRRAGLDLATVDRFAVNSATRPFQKETLARAGVPLDRILETDVVPHVACERMLLPSYPGISGFPPRWACDFLRERLGGSTTPRTEKTPERIYLSRQRSTTRRLANEDELLALLERAGFTKIHAEEHTVAEQAALFGGARAVVGLHGSGLSNLVFCSPGTLVVELFPPIKVTVVHYAVLSAQVGLRYRAVVGQLVREDRPHGDLTVRPESLAALL